MGVKSIKRVAADILKAGISRIKIKQSKELEEAITRDDVKKLIRKGIVYKIQKKGTSKFHAKKIKKQKKRGRRKGRGSRKGKARARMPKKQEWMKTVRALRRLLKRLKEEGRIDGKTYREFYLRVKGGEFRNKKHLLGYLREHEFIKVKENERKAENNSA